MTWVDYVIVGVILASLLLGGLRGFVRELLALAGWVAALVLALWFGPQVAQALPASWEPLARLALGSLLVFVLTVFAVGLGAALLSRLLKAAGLGGTDRMLGAVFGLLRGLLVVLALVVAASWTRLTAQPAWKESWLTPALTSFVNACKPWLPESVQPLVKTTGTV